MKLPYEILYLIIHYLNDNYTAKSIVTSDKHMYNTYTSYLKHISCKFVSITDISYMMHRHIKTLISVEICYMLNPHTWIPVIWPKKVYLYNCRFTTLLKPITSLVCEELHIINGFNNLRPLKIDLKNLPNLKIVRIKSVKNEELKNVPKNCVVIVEHLVV